MREAVGLLVLFVSQVAIEFAIIQMIPEPQATALCIDVLYACTAIYPVGGTWLFYTCRGVLRNLLPRTTTTAREATRLGSVQPGQAD